MTKRRAGGPREHGKLDKPRGAFRLAADLDAAGALGVTDAVERVIADMERQELTGRVSRLTLHKVGPALTRFGGFAAAYGAETLADVDGVLCQRWCTAAKSNGRSPALPGRGERASVASSNARKVMLHGFFTTCQALGLTDRDPSAWVDLPPRTTRSYRPLTEEEAGRCRKVAHQRVSETLLPAGTGVALRGVTTAEMAAIRVQDCYPTAGRVWAHGGGVRTAPRWVALDSYASDAVAARIAHHAARVAPQDLPGTLLLYKPKNPDAPGQKRQGATCMQLARVLRLAGLADDITVRPGSFVEYAATVLFAETRSLPAVAAALGMSSLDAIADALHHDWRTEHAVTGPPGVDDPVTPLSYAGVTRPGDELPSGSGA